MKSLMSFASLLTTLLIMYCGCAPKIDPKQSALLDNAQAAFFGDADHREQLGDAVVWDEQHMLLLVNTKENDKDNLAPLSKELWLVNMNRQKLWDKPVEQLESYDLARVDSNHVFVLLNYPKAAAKSEFVLWKLNRSGEIVQEIALPLPPGMIAARVHAMDDDHFLIVAWERDQSREFRVEDLHIDADGKQLSEDWDFDGTNLFPLPKGDLLGLRYGTGEDAPAKRLTRYRKDGSVVWKTEQPLDTSSAIILGAAETVQGDVIVSAFAKRGFAPVLAKFSTEGKRLWLKSPPEMQGYRIYNIQPWVDGHYLVAAQKTLVKGSLSMETWDCLAAFVIDGEGKILDRDILPKHWTMPIWGAMSLNPNRLVFAGVGGEKPEDFVKQFDIALYTLDRK